MIFGREQKKIRYAVVGLGYIAQEAILPAFKHARNSEVTALVSNDPVKLRKLGRKYGVEHLYSYEEYEHCLRSNIIDAVLISLPNDMHRDFAVKAADARIHVLCEKPMAVTETECEEMIRAAEENHVKLMVGYRLHFEEANLRAIETISSGKIGTPRFFEAMFGMQVKDENIRLRREHGGGTLYDIGIYCINAARYIFQAEPIEVVAFSANNGEKRFSEVDELSSALLRFPGERLATFTTCFNTPQVSSYQVCGTKGRLRVEPAFEYAADLRHELYLNGSRPKERLFPQRDQFGPELIYFSDCILRNEDPEPSGYEGLADVRVIRALYQSVQQRTPIRLPEFVRRKRPSMKLEMRRPAVRKQKLVHAEAPERR